MCYLIAWERDYELKDIEGYTPLHLAVKSVEDFGYTRPVRTLLIRGADRNERNIHGLRPCDLIDDITDND